jgi:c-di-GMP-binding flagellar brake protein YcgR
VCAVAGPGEAEHRNTGRVHFRALDNLKVRYKFLSRLEQFSSEEIFSGVLLNLSDGGALIEGPVPALDWLPRLGDGSILVGANILVTPSHPLKALCTLRWSRPALKLGCFEMGLQFMQIEPEHLTELSRFLIRHQIRTRKTGRRPLER